MTVGMTYLVWTVVLTPMLAVIAVTGAMLQVGLPTLTGNRENMPEFTGWAGRATRAHRNTLESFVLFAVAIIVAKLVNVSNSMTVLGAMLFFWGRVAHAVIYVIGIPWLRAATWAVSIVGLLMILAQLAT